MGNLIVRFTKQFNILACYRLPGVMQRLITYQYSGSVQYPYPINHPYTHTHSYANRDPNTQCDTHPRC